MKNYKEIAEVVQFHKKGPKKGMPVVKRNGELKTKIVLGETNHPMRKDDQRIDKWLGRAYFLLGGLIMVGSTYLIIASQ